MVVVFGDRVDDAGDHSRLFVAECFDVGISAGCGEAVAVEVTDGGNLSIVI